MSRAVHSVMGGNLGRRCDIEFAEDGGFEECSDLEFEFVVAAAENCGYLAGSGTETLQSRGCVEKGGARGMCSRRKDRESRQWCENNCSDGRDLNLMLDAHSSNRRQN